MTKTELKIKQKLLDEIQNCAGAKKFNLQHGTINGREKDILFECLGFLNMISYSCVPIKEIKRIWDNSNLAFK